MNSRMDILVSDLCDEIDWLKTELKIAQAEAQKWRTMHDNLVLRDIEHGHAMMANMVNLVLKRPNV